MRSGSPDRFASSSPVPGVKVPSETPFPVRTENRPPSARTNGVFAVATRHPPAAVRRRPNPAPSEATTPSQGPERVSRRSPHEASNLEPDPAEKVKGQGTGSAPAPGATFVAPSASGPAPSRLWTVTSPAVQTRESSALGRAGPGDPERARRTAIGTMTVGEGRCVYRGPASPP